MMWLGSDARSRRGDDLLSRLRRGRRRRQSHERHRLHRRSGWRRRWRCPPDRLPDVDRAERQCDPLALRFEADVRPGLVDTFPIRYAPAHDPGKQHLLRVERRQQEAQGLAEKTARDAERFDVAPLARETRPLREMGMSGLGKLASF